uniref:Uncharacterized protein n=1 Tax=Lactuca sativa TaxID=4236 RepID=A0A9R1UUW2_LACSA|nr:hypothetical protein LSAT_V11C800394200 [Lactuca sativa]
MTGYIPFTSLRLVFDHEREDLLGRHDAPVRCIEYSYATGQVITGSLDKTLKCWDPRGGGAQECALVGTYGQPERVYSVSLVGNRVVVATAGRHVNVYDLRNMSQPEQRRESSLKYQTICVQCYPNGTRYALSSVEGRVAMEFFELTETGQAKKYAFKCQRKSEAGRDIVYPVNAIAFHPINEMQI